MSIHLIAAYVPDGTLVRYTAQHRIVEGKFHRESCLLVTEGLLLTLTEVTLLEIVRFPYEEEESEAEASEGPCNEDERQAGLQRVVDLVQRLRDFVHSQHPHLVAMTPLRRLLLHPATLHTWLAQQPPGASIGQAGMAGSCPLSRFLRAAGFVAVWITLETSSGTSEDGRLSTYNPAWLVDFLAAVDARPRGKPITAQEALALLQAVEVHHVAHG